MVLRRKEEKTLEKGMLPLRGFVRELKGLTANFSNEILSMCRIDGAIMDGNTLKKARCKNANILIVQTEIMLGMTLQANF